MKKFDYIVIQAPMISELGLKGNSLLVFALIHSYTRDQKHTFRASLKDMAEWFSTSENAINSTLKALVKSGYINKMGTYNAPEYTTNFEALMEKVEAEGALRMDRIYAEKSTGLLNQYPSQNALEAKTTESVALLNQYGKGTESVVLNPTESVASPINKNINIYKYYSCSYSALNEEQKEEEQKQFFRIFFFRGAADPAAEVKRFVGHNEASGWMNKSGKVYDKTEKRLGLAELWEFKTGQREDMAFLKMWVKLYNRVADVEGADILMNPAVRTRFSEDCMAICCTREIYQFIEANLDKVKDIIRDYAGNRKIIYSNIKQ